MAEFWEKSKSLECFSTEDKGSEYHENHIYTRCNGGLRSVKKQSNQIIGRADCEEDPVLCSKIDKENNILYTVHKSKLIRAWKTPSLESHNDFPPLKTDHKNPIVLISVKGTRLITAASDSVLKVWHLGFRHNSGVLRGCSTLPLCLEYAEFGENIGNIVICGTLSGTVYAWNSDTNELISQSSKHFTQVSAIKAISSSKSFVSVGRDKTMIFWSWNLQPVKIVPVFEEIETIQILPKTLAEKIFCKKNIDEFTTTFLTAGEKGKLRFWDSQQMSEILHNNKDGGTDQKDFLIEDNVVPLPNQIINDVLVGSEDLVILQDDLFNFCHFTENKNKLETDCISANQHETLDMIIVGEEYLVLATMSTVIKVYNLKLNKLMIATGGHSDSIMAVARLDEKNFASCGKDHSVCMWNITNDGVRLIAKGTGHSSYVGALAASQKFICSASKDGILKVWKKPKIQEDDEKEEVTELQTLRTVLAHDQEINGLSVSHDGEMAATASQDKTCKIWRIKDMALLTTLTGHRRGIWKTHFTEDSIWTGSADCAIKRWSLKSFQCLSTFEGHLASVLSLTLVDSKRIASVGSDGLLKVWDIKIGEALGTVDAHEDKIWAVTYSEETQEIITAGRDGNIFFWTDKTEEHKEIERQKSNELIKTDQMLSNYLQSGKLDKALKLSLRLDRPRQTKKTLIKLRNINQMDNAVRKLDLDLKNVLFKYVSQWNTIGGVSCELAQAILQILLTDYIATEKEDRAYTVDSKQIAGLLAYTDKHYRRLDKLESRLAVVDLLLAQM